jgi:hypothetical protein
VTDSIPGAQAERDTSTRIETRQKKPQGCEMHSRWSLVRAKMKESAWRRITALPLRPVVR